MEGEGAINQAAIVGIRQTLGKAVLALSGIQYLISDGERSIDIGGCATIGLKAVYRKT